MNRLPVRAHNNPPSSNSSANNASSGASQTGSISSSMAFRSSFSGLLQPSLSGAPKSLETLRTLLQTSSASSSAGGSSNMLTNNNLTNSVANSGSTQNAPLSSNSSTNNTATVNDDCLELNGSNTTKPSQINPLLKEASTKESMQSTTSESSTAPNDTLAGNNVSSSSQAGTALISLREMMKRTEYLTCVSSVLQMGSKDSVSNNSNSSNLNVISPTSTKEVIDEKQLPQQQQQHSELQYQHVSAVSSPETQGTTSIPPFQNTAASSVVRSNTAANLQTAVERNATSNFLLFSDINRSTSGGLGGICGLITPTTLPSASDPWAVSPSSKSLLNRGGSSAVHPTQQQLHFGTGSTSNIANNKSHFVMQQSGSHSPQLKPPLHSGAHTNIAPNSSASNFLLPSMSLPGASTSTSEFPPLLLSHTSTFPQSSILIRGISTSDPLLLANNGNGSNLERQTSANGGLMRLVSLLEGSRGEDSHRDSYGLLRGISTSFNANQSATTTNNNTNNNHSTNEQQNKKLERDVTLTGLDNIIRASLAANSSIESLVSLGVSGPAPANPSANVPHEPANNDSNIIHPPTSNHFQRPILQLSAQVNSSSSSAQLPVANDLSSFYSQQQQHPNQLSLNNGQVISSHATSMSDGSHVFNSLQTQQQPINYSNVLVQQQHQLALNSNILDEDQQLESNGMFANNSVNTGASVMDPLVEEELLENPHRLNPVEYMNSLQDFPQDLIRRLPRFHPGISLSLGEGGRDLVRKYLKISGYRGRPLHATSIPELLSLAHDFGLWYCACRVHFEHRKLLPMSKAHAFFRWHKARLSENRRERVRGKSGGYASTYSGNVAAILMNSQGTHVSGDIFSNANGTLVMPTGVSGSGNAAGNSSSSTNHAGSVYGLSSLGGSVDTSHHQMINVQGVLNNGSSSASSEPANHMNAGANSAVRGQPQHQSSHTPPPRQSVIAYEEGIKLQLGTNGRKELLRLLRDAHDAQPARMEEKLQNSGLSYTKIRDGTLEQLFRMAFVMDVWNQAVDLHLRHIHNKQKEKQAAAAVAAAAMVEMQSGYHGGNDFDELAMYNNNNSASALQMGSAPVTLQQQQQNSSAASGQTSNSLNEMYKMHDAFYAAALGGAKAAVDALATLGGGRNNVDSPGANLHEMIPRFNLPYQLFVPENNASLGEKIEYMRSVQSMIEIQLTENCRNSGISEETIQMYKINMQEFQNLQLYAISTVHADLFENHPKKNISNDISTIDSKFENGNQSHVTSAVKRPLDYSKLDAHMSLSSDNNMNKQLRSHHTHSNDEEEEVSASTTSAGRERKVARMIVMEDTISLNSHQPAVAARPPLINHTQLQQERFASSSLENIASLNPSRMDIIRSISEIINDEALASTMIANNTTAQTGNKNILPFKEVSNPIQQCSSIPTNAIAASPAEKLSCSSMETILLGDTSLREEFFLFLSMKRQQQKDSEGSNDDV